MRLIDADVIIKGLDDALDKARENGEDVMDVLKMELFKNFMKLIISYTPTIETETTLEQVREYCRKRNLVLVTREFFIEMMKRSEAAKMTPEEAVDRFIRWADGDEHAWDDVPDITHFIPIKDVLEL